MRIVAFACAALIPAASLAAVTYSFDWYCTGCTRLGMGTNGREGPFGSGSACEGARSTMSGSLASRGCGAGRCFNAQPCVATGRPDLQPAPAVSVPRAAVPETARVPVYVDPRLLALPDESPQRQVAVDDEWLRAASAWVRGPIMIRDP